MKSMVMEKISVFFDKVIFRTPLTGLLFSMIITAIVQSSSVTTSLIVPIAGAGIITLEQAFPYILGANVGTTITALMASLVTQNQAAVAVAFAHLLFNIYGIIVFWPARFLPLAIARTLGKMASKNRMFPIYMMLILFIIIPLILIQIMR